MSTPNSLPPGAWRLDPFSRIVRYVYDNPATALPDAFDEPLEDVVPVKDLPPIKHGTPGGVRAHNRRGEKVCAVCAADTVARRKARVQRQYEAGDPRYTCECGAIKLRPRAARCKPCSIAYRWGYNRRVAA